jgi:alpha-ribazole phosphatase/probable phosphoglycerate mutase
MPKLILIRHGQTDYNAQRRYQGHTDIPLNDTGKRQAEALRKRLSHMHITGAYTSTLIRARTTAQIALEGHHSGLVAEEMLLLREASGGKVEGLNWEEMNAKFPEEVKKWHSDRYNNPPPGGESLKEVRERVVEGINIILKKHHKEEDNIAIFVHGGVIGVTLCHYMGMDLNKLWQWRIDSCSMTILDVYEKAAILSLFNDTNHIDSQDQHHGK